MIKLENTVTLSPEQWMTVIMGTRNPMNSWDRSDSKIVNSVMKTRQVFPGVEETYYDQCAPYISIGEKDFDLMMKLRNAGTDHRKFMRMIVVYVDITAPLYWWKEFDTYKVGTVANSCSTMHKIHSRDLTMDDFSTEHMNSDSERILSTTIDNLNRCRESFIHCKNIDSNKVPHAPDVAKNYWWQMIQMLPTSYNQKRTVMMNYENLMNMYHARKNHKLDEWREFCKWIEGLPYSELIISKKETSDEQVSD